MPAFQDALVVAQTGSVGEAARRLHKTSSAVSQQIRRIEARFGVTLFERSGAASGPSATGEALLGSLTRLFAEASSLEGLLGELAAAHVTTLRIAAGDYLGEALLLPVLRRLFDEGVPLRFEITTTNSHRGGAPGAAGHVDVAVVSTDRALTADETRSVPSASAGWRRASCGSAAAEPIRARLGSRAAPPPAARQPGAPHPRRVPRPPAACGPCRPSMSPACRCCCLTCARIWAWDWSPAWLSDATTAASPSRPPTSRPSTCASPAARPSSAPDRSPRFLDGFVDEARRAAALSAP